ncbi:MAG: redoxin family protein [Flavobacteriales bacterium]
MKFFFSLLFFFVFSPFFSQLKVKNKAPLSTLSMRSTQQADYRLEQLIQKNGLLVIFSCNSCPFVVGSDDFPGWEKQYDTLYALAQQNQIGMVLLNSNEGKREGADSFEEMMRHAASMNYRMPYLVDVNSVIADAFGAKTTPHVYLFDETLTLIYTGSIDNTWDKLRTKDEHYLMDALAAKGAGKKIKINTTDPKGCGIKRTPPPSKN